MTAPGIPTLTLLLAGAALGCHDPSAQGAAAGQQDTHLLTFLIAAVTALAVLGTTGVTLLLRWSRPPGAKLLIALALCALGVILSASLTGMTTTHLPDTRWDMASLAALFLAIAWGAIANIIHDAYTPPRAAPAAPQGPAPAPGSSRNPDPPGPEPTAPTLARRFLEEHLETWQEGGRTAHDWRYPEVFIDPGQIAAAGGTVLTDPRGEPDETPLLLVAFTDGSWFIEDLHNPDPTVHSGAQEDFHRAAEVLTSAARQDASLTADAHASPEKTSQQHQQQP